MQEDNLDEMEAITEAEVRSALKKMNNGKTVGPENLPKKVWKCLGEEGITFLCEMLNKICEEEHILEAWRKSTLIPIYKNKGDIMSCCNYRRIKLMSHSMKLYKRTIEGKLRRLVNISEEQFGFMKGKLMTDAICALRQVQEKYREGNKELHSMFIDLEKAYDRVPREQLYWCMRAKNVPEKYIRVVQDMYMESKTVVKCVAGTSVPFKVEVGLQQGTAPTPLLFAIIMDTLTDDITKEVPWSMMFTDDVVFCCEEKAGLEEDMERWCNALEKRGMKVLRAKTE